MSRSWRLYLDDLIESAEKIGRFVAGRTFASVSADEAVFDAILFNLQVIGEVVKKLPGEARSAMPDAIGAGPARLRDLMAHPLFSRSTRKLSGKWSRRMCRDCWSRRACCGIRWIETASLGTIRRESPPQCHRHPGDTRSGIAENMTLAGLAKQYGN